MCSFRTLPLLAAIVVAAPALAGPLTPPGAPAPTMKTIQEAEPRTPISQADIPLTIDRPGSYYLTDNLLASGVGDPFVIRVAAHNVTLDLRGFTIFGSTEVTTADDGVLVIQEIENVAIRNGTITRCLQQGIDANDAGPIVIESIRLIRNFQDGLVIEGRSQIRNCFAFANVSNGFRITGLAAGGVIANSTAEANGGAGFILAQGMTAENCVATQNQSGFFVDEGATLRNCTATANSADGFRTVGGALTACVAFNNGSDGFDASFDTDFVNCRAENNTDFGFRLVGGSTLRDCTANENGRDGFLCNGFKARIEGCSAWNNTQDGFDLGGSDILFIRNNAGDNGMLDFNIGAGNVVGPLVTAANIAVSSNPHANYSH